MKDYKKHLLDGHGRNTSKESPEPPQLVPLRAEEQLLHLKLSPSWTDVSFLELTWALITGAWPPCACQCAPSPGLAPGQGHSKKQEIFKILQ